MKYSKLLKAVDVMLYLIGKKRSYLLRKTGNSYKQ